MSSIRLRLAAALVIASTAAFVLTSCAPAQGPQPTASTGAGTSKHHVAKHHTPKPKPIVLAQPASRYSVGCGDLISPSTVATLFAVPMTTIDATAFDRQSLQTQIPDAEYIKDLGALDCTWYDGAASNNNSHNLELQVLPVTLAEWNTYAQGGATTIENGVSIDCASDSGFNSCQYEAYTNGSRYTLELENMKPVPTADDVLPPAIQAVVTTINAKLSSTTLGPVPPAQHPSVTLPTVGTSMLTATQARAALGIPTSAQVEVDCGGDTDGPWEIFNEAQQEVDGSLDCEFGLPYNGGEQGPYGLFEFIPAGQWAAKQMEADTPTETAVSDPSLPAGDSLYQWTDDQGELNGDLTLGGNLIEINFFNPNETGDPATTVPLPTALVNLANALETTIRGQ